MAICPIRCFPDAVLRMKSRPVASLNQLHRQIILDLIDTMVSQPGGIGIAAPQIGHLWQIAVVDVSKKEKHRHRLIMVNPEIIELQKEKFGREGCMSVPHYTANVKRMQQIRVRWYDEEWALREMITEGIEAICIQHEVDHLNGLLFLDRVGSIKRDVFRRKKYL